jgi:cytoskeletal protein RodZ
MKKFAVVAVIPLFAGFLWAQTEQTTTRTETTTSRNTFGGTLVDASCRSTHTEHKESSTSTPDATTTRTETTQTTSDSMDCPVTTTTTTFGLVTPEGKYVRFDEPSNTRIVEMVKSKKEWHKLMKDRKPVKVRVIGAANGDTIVVESIK